MTRFGSSRLLRWRFPVTRRFVREAVREQRKDAVRGHQGALHDVRVEEEADLKVGGPVMISCNYSLPKLTCFLFLYPLNAYLSSNCERERAP